MTFPLTEEQSAKVVQAVCEAFGSPVSPCSWPNCCGYYGELPAKVLATVRAIDDLGLMATWKEREVLRRINKAADDTVRWVSNQPSRRNMTAINQAVSEVINARVAELKKNT
jgi:hypothetical protein